MHDAEVPRSEGPRPGIEQRKVPRVPLEVEVGIHGFASSFVGFGETVSSDGVFVATFHLLPIGTAVGLTFVLPNRRSVVVNAVVRWIRDPRGLAARDTPPGMGFQFVDLRPADKTHVEAYVTGGGTAAAAD